MAMCAERSAITGVCLQRRERLTLKLQDGRSSDVWWTMQRGRHLERTSHHDMSTGISSHSNREIRLTSTHAEGYNILSDSKNVIQIHLKTTGIRYHLV
jgi:uncharacterized protein YaeQ